MKDVVSSSGHRWGLVGWYLMVGESVKQSVVFGMDKNEVVWGVNGVGKCGGLVEGVLEVEVCGVVWSYGIKVGVGSGEDCLIVGELTLA